ncbi:MAG TPA: hypothetical protein VJS91_03000 [Nitrososphaeraceae archaeon]|nr:hypothetical protein [Nitrososphaeraceae archaeon]
MSGTYYSVLYDLTFSGTLSILNKDDDDNAVVYTFRRLDLPKNTIDIKIHIMIVKVEKGKK